LIDTHFHYYTLYSPVHKNTIRYHERVEHNTQAELADMPNCQIGQYAGIFICRVRKFGDISSPFRGLRQIKRNINSVPLWLFDSDSVIVADIVF